MLKSLRPRNLTLGAQTFPRLLTSLTPAARRDARLSRRRTGGPLTLCGLVVALVAPLHVNLPTRGVRYSFSQVLQTELRKPMTIRLLAENTKVPSWTTRIGLAVLGFGVLWAIVAAFNRRRTTV